MGKVLVIAGLVVAGVGLLMMAGVPFARLPGDIVYRRGHFTLYLPLGTSILLSVLLTLLVMFWRR